MHPEWFVALQRLTPQHTLSRAVGRLAASEQSTLKNLLINQFCRVFKPVMSDAVVEDPTAYPSFNEFFTRALKPGARPLPEDPAAMACPADGSISQIGRLRGDAILQAKGVDFSATALLGGDAALAEEFTGGHFATVYLSPMDYHRVHMPFGGTLRRTIYVPGRLFSVNGATASALPGLFARNERLVCIFDTERGPMAVVLVGAMIVAGIETVWRGVVTPPQRVLRHESFPVGAPKLTRGEELGRFYLGSTAIVLLPDTAFAWAPLAAGDKVRMGQTLGSFH